VLNRGRHLYSAGWPSRWALAHILVLYYLYEHILKGSHHLIWDKWSKKSNEELDNPGSYKPGSSGTWPLKQVVAVILLFQSDHPTIKTEILKTET